MRDLKKTSNNITHYDYLDTPIGEMLIAGCENYVRFVSFPEAPEGSQGHTPRQPLPEWQRDEEMFTQAKQELTEYFAGERSEFTVPLKPEGTEFQMSAWRALQKIPYGETRSYGQQAALIGNPKASRAVGGANNANPIPVIIPCHRVIGANGTMTGFGGGIPTKEFLLDLEGMAAGTRLL